MMTAFPGGNLLYRSQYFASSDAFTVPTSMPAGVVYVSLKGGGAGGRGYTGTNYGSGGLEGQEKLRIPVTGLTAGDSITVTVGAGGAANSGGSASSFGAHVTAAGGQVGLHDSTAKVLHPAQGKGAGETKIDGNAGVNAADNSGAGGGGSANSAAAGTGGSGYVLVEWYERLT